MKALKPVLMIIILLTMISTVSPVYAADFPVFHMNYDVHNWRGDIADSLFETQDVLSENIEEPVEGTLIEEWHNEDYNPEDTPGEINLTLSGDEWIEDTSVIEDAIDEIADEEDISANDILIIVLDEPEGSIELFIIVHLTDETTEENYPDFAGEGEDYDDEESFMETEE